MENDNIRLLITDISALAAQVSRLVEDRETALPMWRWIQDDLKKAHDNLEEVKEYLEWKSSE